MIDNTLKVSDKKIYPSIDWMKLILSFLVVAIHVNPLGNTYGYLLFPWVRVCVPLFFISSSYLLFEKAEKAVTDKEKLHILFRFLKRNILLYAFWFVILFPATVLIKDFFSEGWIRGVKKIILCFFFSSTFKGSWYIMASMWAAVIVYWLGGGKKSRYLLLVSLILYGFCCLYSVYSPWSMRIHTLKAIRKLYPKYWANSFLVAIFWFTMGRIIAENREKWKSHRYHFKGGLLLSICALAAEGYFVRHMGFFTSKNDCYFSLALVCPLLFLLILEWKPKSQRAGRWRSFTVVLFCLHPSTAAIFKTALKRFWGIHQQFRYALVTYVMTIIVCMFGYLVITALKKRCSLFNWAC